MADEIKYGFDGDGGFIAINETKKIAAYAYHSSLNAEKAKKNPQAVAVEMVTEVDRPYLRALNLGAYQRLAPILERVS